MPETSDGARNSEWVAVALRLLDMRKGQTKGRTVRKRERT